MKKNLSAFISSFLTISMLINSFVSAADTQVPNDELIVKYDFKNVSSTIVPDVTGNGMQGIIYKTDTGGSKIVTDSIYGNEVNALYLSGGEEGGWLKLPAGVLGDNKSITISCWVNIENTTGYQRIWDFGTGTDKYIYLLNDGWNDGARGYTAAITKSGWSKEECASKGTSEEGYNNNLPTNQWVLTTVTLDSENKTLKLYQDGALVNEAIVETVIEDLGNTTNNYIGKGQYSDAPTNMMIADFRIYGTALTPEQVSKLFVVPDETRVNADYNVLDLGDIYALTSDIDLPALGNSGSTITWTSSDEAVISTTGKVTRPKAGNTDAKVTLTAEIKYGSAKKTKDFEAIVLAYPTDEKIVEHDLNKINLGMLDSVIEDLSLPKTGEWGSEITWNSSDKKHLSADGTVCRPPIGACDAEINLIATARKGDATFTKEFKVTVKPVFYVPEIKSAEQINISTLKGSFPTLPAMANITYTNGEKDKLKVIWPTSIDKTKYEKSGEFSVEGTVIDSDFKVTANVTVLDEDGSTPFIQAEGFKLEDITLNGDSILTDNRDLDITYLKLLDSDRMLYNFRKAFGEDTKGASPLGGWEAEDGLLRGHSTGHYLSALSLAYASTKDEQIKEKLDYMVSELHKLQLKSKGDPSEFKTNGTAESSPQSGWSKDPSEWGEGFLSAYSPDQFALLEQYAPYGVIWAPYYTLHKIIAGFIDAYTYTGNEEALEAAKGIGSWIYDRLSETTEQQRTAMWKMYIAGEFGGMNESLAKLYEITNDEKYIEAAKFFDNNNLFEGLAANEDNISGLHANQHIPQIIGAIEEYKATGEKKYYDIAENFWNIVTTRYAYSIGGVGTGEMFKEPYAQGENIVTDKNCETCAAYNLLKLSKELYAYNPENAKYMDYYERTLINQISASINPVVSEDAHLGVTYMLPIGAGQRKSYSDDYYSFTCCHGTGMENHVKYQENVYFKSTDGSALYVNLYMPSTLEWTEKGFTIVQETEFPSDYSKITVNGNGEMAIKLRVPYWAVNGFTVSVNGEKIVESAETSTYVTIDREWNENDIIEINMPFALHLDKTPDKIDDTTAASIMYGPIVMVAKDSNQEWTTLNLAPQLTNSITVNPSDDLRKLSLSTAGLEFIPMFMAHNLSYTTYFKVNTIGGDSSLVLKEVESIEIETKTGEKPILPASLKGTYSDGSQYQVKITWDNIEKSSYEESGIFTVYGKIDGTEIKAICIVKVLDNKEPTPPDDPDNPSEPSEPNEPTEPNNPSNPSDNNPSDGTNPKTGLEDVGAWLTFMSFAIISLISTTKKKTK